MSFKLEIVDFILNSGNTDSSSRSIVLSFLIEQWAVTDGNRLERIIDMLDGEAIKLFLAVILKEIESPQKIGNNLSLAASRILKRCPETTDRIKYIIFILLGRKSADSLKAVAEIGTEHSTSLSGIYPGIVTGAVEACLHDSRLVDLAVDMWRTWLPGFTQGESDVKGSLLGLAKIRALLGNSSNVKVFLEQLQWTVPQHHQITEISLDLGIECGLTDGFLAHALANTRWDLVGRYLRFCTGPALVDEIGLAVKSYLSAEKFESACLTDVAEKAEVLAIIDPQNTYGKFLESSYTESSRDCLVKAFPEFPLIETEVLPYLSSHIFFDGEELEFADYIIVGSLLADDKLVYLVENRISKIPRCFSKSILFARTYLLARWPVNLNSRMLHRTLYEILSARCSRYATLGAVGTEAMLKIESGTEWDVIEIHMDSVVDSLIRTIALHAGHVVLNEGSDVINYLVHNHEIPDTLQIDLVREILASYKPRDFPEWALKVIAILVKRLGDRGRVHTDLSHDRLLTPAELLCSEVVARLRFVIEVGDPNSSFVKSVWAISILNNAVRVFGGQCRIVRICEFFDIVTRFMQPDKISGSQDQDDLRLLVALQLIHTIAQCGGETVSFFSDQIRDRFLPLWCERLKSSAPILHALEDSIYKASHELESHGLNMVIPLRTHKGHSERFISSFQ